VAKNLLVKIEGDATSLERAFDKSTAHAKKFDNDLGKIGRGAVGGSGIFRGLGRSLAFASTAFLGGFGLVAAIRASVGEFSNMEQAAAQTNAVIKSTGGVAGVTAEHVNQLAEEMANLTGTSASEIHAAENLLLSFSNIRDVAGKNNDVFDQASKAALDLAARLGVDLHSAAITVGKALQDPVRGLQSLTRAGVLLSKSQQELVKHLVATGDTLGAQKLLLRQIREFAGGAAEVTTLSASFAVLRNNALDLGAKITGNLQPALQNVLDRANKWITNLHNQERVMKAASDAGHILGDAFKTLKGLFDDLSKVTGSARRSAELLLGVFLAYKGLRLAQTLVSIATDIGLVGSTAATSTAEVGALKTELAFPTTLNTGIGTTAGEVAGVGAAASTATAEVAGVRTGLLGLSTLGEIAIPVLIAVSIKELSKEIPIPDAIGGKTTRKLLFGSIVDVVKEAHRDLKPVTDEFQKGLDRGISRTEESLRRLGLLHIPVPHFDVRSDASRAKGDEDFTAKPPTEPPPALTKKQIADAAARARQAREAFRQQIQDQAQLAVDRATLTAGVQDDLGALGKYLQLLKRRIAGEEAVIANEKASSAARARAQQAVLTNEKEAIGVQQQINDLQKQQRDQALARLQFNVDRTAATTSVRDDIAALRKLNAALERAIKAGGDTLALEQQRFDVQQKIIDAQKQLKDQRQFRLLGLGPTGDEPIPGVKGLKRQLAATRKLIDDTFLDTRKNRGLLAGIKKVLADPGGVADVVRGKINSILDDLRQQLKTTSVDVTKFTASAGHQFTLAGAHPQGGIVINGGLHLHGIQDVKALENALAKRRKQRAHARGGTR
jgi:hypothetical protein